MFPISVLDRLLGEVVAFNSMSKTFELADSKVNLPLGEADALLTGLSLWMDWTMALKSFFRLSISSAFFFSASTRR
jgi:hypothetical protein